MKPKFKPGDRVLASVDLDSEPVLATINRYAGERMGDTHYYDLVTDEPVRYLSSKLFTGVLEHNLIALQLSDEEKAHRNQAFPKTSDRSQTIYDFSEREEIKLSQDKFDQLHPFAQGYIYLLNCATRLEQLPDPDRPDREWLRPVHDWLEKFKVMYEACNVNAIPFTEVEAPELTFTAREVSILLREAFKL